VKILGETRGLFVPQESPPQVKTELLKHRNALTITWRIAADEDAKNSGRR
jgi:hypothetical protein